MSTETNMLTRVFKAPAAMLSDIRSNSELTWQFTRREAVGRYKGSYLGVVWLFLVPILMLAVYTFVFSVVFRARWPGAGNESMTTFGLLLFAGLIPFNVFAETVSRAPGLILMNPNYVKKVVFPLEVLPFSIVGAALFHSILSILVLLLGVSIFMHKLVWTVVLLPIIALPLALLCMGLCWLISALGVFIRDIGHVTGVLVTFCLFLTPIFYPLQMVPPRLQNIIQLNPLTSIVDSFRRTLIHGTLPDWGWWLYALGISFVVFLAGYIIFTKLKRNFADVM